MKRITHYVLPLVFCFGLIPLVGKAQNNYWSFQNRPAEVPVKDLPAATASFLTLDIPALQARLAGGNRIVAVPNANGGFTAFTLTETAVMNAATAAAHPEIKTYTGTNTQGEELRLTVCPAGVMGRISGRGNLLYFQPLQSQNPSVVVAFRAADAFGFNGVKCGVDEEIMKGLPQPSVPGNLQKTTYGDVSKRTYTISVAATNEYTSWAGGQSAALARIVTSINNVNAIYERDFAIHFTLNTPNSIIYNTVNDPYSQGSSALGVTSLTENQAVLTNSADVATAGGFNLGHVFNAGWNGGLAYTPSACNSSLKGGAASGLDPAVFPGGPSGPVFDLTVAHEICHQFNGAHSFAANTGGCSGNTSGANGWEPGGGSTIMAYAGTCTGLAYQNNSDPYFHGGNMLQVSNYMIGTGTCAATASAGNSAPVLGSTPNVYTIPHSTPFRLALPATDADGDALTYSWEQLDPVGGTGTSTAPQSTATSGPQFRSFPATSNPVQYFPSLDGLLTGSLSYEVLPTVARNLTFRGTVRDNHAGAGRTAHKDVTVSTASCGPFSIISPATATTLAANGSNTITLTWNTAATCVTSSNINIRFSVDGGKTYPYLVLAATPNDGTEAFVVPNLPTCSGRFMIESTTGIFFNISPANVTITSGCAANGVTLSPADPVNIPVPGSATLNTNTAPQYGTAIALPASGSITTTDPASVLSADNGSGGCASFGGNPTRYDSYTFTSGSNGSHTFSLAAGSGSTFGIVINLFEETYEVSNPCKSWIASNFNSSTGSLANTLTATLCSKKKYVLVVSSFDASFPALPASYNLSVTSPAGAQLFTGQPLPAGTNYVYAIVSNATGNISEVRTTPDLSNAVMYPGGSYTIYGFNTTATAAFLNTNYAGGTYTALYNAALNQTGGLCAQQSQNSRQVNIASPLPLPVQLLAFGARWKAPGVAEAAWEVGKEEAVAAYVLERSYDGSTFAKVARRAALAGADYRSYEVADEQIAPLAEAVYYRLRLLENTGNSRFSGTVKLERTLPAGRNAFAVTPNPIAGGKLAGTLWLTEAAPVSITVQEVSGRPLRRLNAAFYAGSNPVSLDLSDLAPGMYLVVVEGPAFRMIEKVLR